MLLACLLTACGGTGALDSADPAFAGLDPAVVNEVLANPAASAKINEEPDATRTSMAQGIVRNFIVCRDFLGAYREWQRTGQVPPVPPLPEPSNPINPSAQSWERDYHVFADPLRSGDINQLRTVLTSDSGCGAWIPAKPNDVSGPTIAQVIQGGG